MKLTKFDDLVNNKQIYTLEIDRQDLAKIRPDDFVHILLREYATSEKVSEALLALEAIARTIEEASNNFNFRGVDNIDSFRKRK